MPEEIAWAPAEARRAAILLVDDNRDLLENLREILQSEGYDVHAEETLRGALAQLERRFEVALVDVRLPDGQGLDLASRLHEAKPDCEVIFLTADSSVVTAAAAVHAGAFAYLVKPCDAHELLKTVQQALRHARLREEKRALAQRAQMAERLAAVGTLAAGLSHEIRNPLNAASLQLQVLERRLARLEGADRAPLLQPLQLVQDEIQRLNRIVEAFLQFARPRSLRFGQVAFSGLLNEVLDFLTEGLSQRQQTLERAVEADLTVHADADALRQVLLNLVLNSLEAAPDHGRLRVCAGGREQRVRLTVEDDGPGVPAELRERIFEPFFTTKATGSGLGLPIVHALLTGHGGTIAVGASPLGGALFSVDLPR